MHVLCTAGHVDHGKSTLVRALTGMEPDRFAEEKRRGMTIDLGFAWTDLPGAGTVAFVDVPGHEKFVGTMLAGAGPVPAAMFVVAADEGWMPQSGEHADALAAAGLEHGLLVITRSDLLDPDLALADAREELAARGLGGWPSVAVSATTGAGLDTLRAALTDLVAALPEPEPDAPTRLWVDRAFTVRGAGTVITGTLPTGRIGPGTELELDGEGGRFPVTVRGVQELNEPVENASAVARVALNLRGLPRDDVARGDALLTPGAWPVARELDVRLHGIGRPAEMPDGPTGLTLHAGSAAVPVRVRPLGTTDDGEVIVRLRPDRPLPLRIGDRAVLRDPGARRVVAGATVLDPDPPPLRRRRGAAKARAQELAGATGVPDADAELTRRGVARAADLVRIGVPRADVDDLATRVPGAAGWLLTAGRAAEAVAALDRAVAGQDPLDPGVPLAAARRAADLPDAALVPAVLTAAGSSLVIRDGRVRSAADAPPPDELLRAAAAVRADLEAAPFTAPNADRLAELGLGAKELAVLERAGELLRVAPDVVLAPDAEDRAVEVLRGLGPTFTPADVRTALGTSRRVVVPLLELLAKRGRTVRTPDGDHRLR
ncbi:selenocysteine-specific translation elongation factor [Pseudonocardia phyllosphaerae]|uniref:selenocysteine-specific translation elongation factor n=1 Tax=Pseudonocardia phyllosphaerae TaxID=3390502 RepID=UPI00397DD344